MAKVQVEFEMENPQQRHLILGVREFCWRPCWCWQDVGLMKLVRNRLWHIEVQAPGFNAPGAHDKRASSPEQFAQNELLVQVLVAYLGYFCPAFFCVS